MYFYFIKYNIIEYPKGGIWVEDDVFFDVINYLTTGQIDDKSKHYIHIINTIGGRDNER